MRRSIYWAALAALLPLMLMAMPGMAGAQPQGDTRLLHYPDICKDTIAFTYGGDVWIAGAQGGAARRLTSGEGDEVFPKFSPDCKWIAFTGQYTGTRQVYVIPVDGGTPRQLTFHNDIGVMPPRGGFDNQVMGWTPDGRQVLFNAHRTPYSDRNARPYLVPAAGGMEKPLPIREGSTGVLSPDGNRYVFAPVMHEWRNWKRYRGGRTPDLWIYDLKANTAEQITKDPAMDYMPVWIGDTIYFVSDRDAKRINNLYAYDTKSRQVRELTHHDTFDVFWPSGDRRIVYENGGWIYLFDPASGKSNRVPIRIEGDLPRTLPYFKNVADDVESASLSPSGKRALLTARGEIFSVPAEKGEIRNLTHSSGVREGGATWSPDGRWVAYLSDRSGEYEIWVRPADGSGQERRVTTDGHIWRFPPQWSPDSKKLAFGDKDRKLFWVDVATGKVTEADQSARADIQDYRWSPDSRFLAYTKTGGNAFPSIWIYALDDGKARQLTSDMTAEAEPTWDPTGRYLYFLSNRDFNLTFSGYEFDYVYSNPTRVYVGVLAKEGPALFLPESDEEEKVKPEEPPGTEAPAKHAKPDTRNAETTIEKPETPGKAEKPEAAPGKAPVRVKVDFDGFEQRVRAIPGPSGNYQRLSASGTAVFYLSQRTANGAPSLKMFNLESRKEDTILDGVAGYDLSADGKKILYRQGESFGIVDARGGQKPGDGKLDLEKLTLRIQPRDEWRQEYVDAWRIFRDWFYDPAIHGVDWKGIRDRYAEMLPSMSTRADLDYLLGEIGGEVSVGHDYVQPGNAAGPKRVEGGLLGAEIEADPSGYYRVAHVFPGENWQRDFRSPLTEPGVHVVTGDYILAVDGQPTNGVDNFYRLLEGKADQVVVLQVNDKPSTQGAHFENVRPVSSEYNLRYLDWVQGTRAKVDKLSGGHIGYIHLPNTAVEGNRELFKNFYPLSTKDALILDDRWNGGGFVPDRMVALLSRPLLGGFVGRGGVFNPTPQFVNTGPKVALINGQAGSGGDAFPYFFKELGLGPLIGTRTWGGLAGLSGNPPLVDGGTLTVPTFRFLTKEGGWAVENEGVAPDIEVIDAPDALARGEDPSLERGVKYLLDQLAKNPPKKITVPPPPKGGAPR
ncbi:MAG TPA: PDZ domain-containing protein [Thermoanaerobaculia bacterium]|nr:PDZ domain-containing protein [Thermoanaerobaculia bacterium]